MSQLAICSGDHLRRSWRSGETVTTDEEIYTQLEADVWPVPRVAITGMVGTASTVAVTTIVRGDPESETLTVLSIDAGCVTEVRVFPPAGNGG